MNCTKTNCYEQKDGSIVKVSTEYQDKKYTVGGVITSTPPEGFSDAKEVDCPCNPCDARIADALEVIAENAKPPITFTGAFECGTDGNMYSIMSDGSKVDTGIACPKDGEVWKPQDTTTTDPDTGVVTQCFDVVSETDGSVITANVWCHETSPAQPNLKVCERKDGVSTVRDITGDFVIRQTCVDSGRQFFFDPAPINSDTEADDLGVLKSIQQGSVFVPNDTCYTMDVRLDGNIHLSRSVQRSYLWYMNLSVNPDTPASPTNTAFGHDEAYWSGYETMRFDPYNPEPKNYTVPPGGRTFHFSLNSRLQKQDTIFDPVLDPTLTKLVNNLFLINWRTFRNDCT